MSRLALLTLPWSGLRPTLRWVGALLTLVFWFSAAMFVRFIDPRWPKGWLGATLILALWLALLGVALGTLLLPALEARRLRLPRLERAAVVSLGLNGMMLLAVTGTPLALLSQHPVPVLELLLMGLAAGLAYALLPFLWVVALCLSPPLLQGLGHLWHWRVIGPLNPRFAAVCAAFVAAAAGGCAWNWRRLLRSAQRTPGMAMRPIVIAFRSDAQVWTFPYVGGAPDPTGAAAGQMPRWLQPEADVRDAGPRELPRGLRVLLGGPYLPLTRGSLMRQLAATVFPVTLVGLMYLPALVRHGWRWSEARPVLILAVTVILGWVLLAGTLMRTTHLMRRWSRPDGELSVLPLLPGLGTSREQTVRLLRALFRPIRTWHMPLILAAVVLDGVGGHGRLSTFVLLLSLGLAPAGEAAAVYCTLGRCRVPKWSMGLVLVVGLVMFMVGLSVAVRPVGSAPPSQVLLGVLLGGSALCYATVSTLAGLGRRALWRQPHPYLAVN